MDERSRYDKGKPDEQLPKIKFEYNKSVALHENSSLNLLRKFDHYFHSLTDFIQKLPISEKGKKYIWVHSFIQFYDTLTPAEDGTLTYGIQTKWQLQQFIKDFKNNFQNLRLKAVTTYSEKLKKMPTNEARKKIGKELYRVRHKEILGEIGGEPVNGWEFFLKSYLLNEREYLNDVASLTKDLPPSQLSAGILKAPVIALFCSLSNEARLILREESGSVSDYCKKVCEHFNLRYSDRVRQGFLNSSSKRNIQKVMEQILPNIDERSRKKIHEHLERKIQPNQKLYA